MKIKLRTIQKFAIICALAFVMTGCGGSNSESGVTTPPIPPQQQEATVSIVRSSASINLGEKVDVTINISNLNAVHYAAFDLSYDASVIEYMDASEGSFFNQGGLGSSTILVALKNGEAGNLAVGISRLAPASEVSGDGTILVLSFKALNSGSTDFNFVEPRAFRNSNRQNVHIDEWIGTSVTVR